LHVSQYQCGVGRVGNICAFEAPLIPHPRGVGRTDAKRRLAIKTSFRGCLSALMAYAQPLSNTDKEFAG